MKVKIKKKRILIYLSIIIALCLAFSSGFSCKAAASSNNQSPAGNSETTSAEVKNTDSEDTLGPVSQNDNTEETKNDSGNQVSDETQDNSDDGWNYDDFMQYFIKPLKLNTESEMEDGFDFELVNIKETSKDDNYNIGGMYPAIKGPSGSNADKFDGEIKAFVNKLSSDFISEVKQANAELAEDFPEGMIFVNELNINGSPQMLGSNISSVLFLNYYFTGGAHGMTLSNPLNYDMKNLKMLELKDVFKNETDYLQKLSDYCRADLEKQLEEAEVANDDMFEDGIAPTYENYSNFVLLKNDIVIIFGQYQIAPYAAGMFGVRIPYKELDAYLVEGLF